MFEFLFGKKYGRLVKKYFRQRTQGRLQDAYATSIEATEAAIAEYGIGSVEHAQALSLVAKSYVTLGDFDEAEKVATDAITIWTAATGPDNQDIVRFVTLLAEMYLNRDRADLAEHYCARSVDYYARSKARDDSGRSLALRNMGALLQAKGELKEAERYYTESLTLRAQSDDVEKTDVCQSMEDLAGLYTRQERYAEAAVMAKKIMETYARIFGVNHGAVLESLVNLYRAEMKAGDYKNARDNCRKAARKLAGILAPDDPVMLEVRAELALLEMRLAMGPAAA